MEIKVHNNILDKEQTKAALTNNKNTIIIAGAGSGKSLTMVGKIKYLVKYKNIKLDEILCITFTNNAAISLQEKIKNELKKDNKVYTFHKLALEIIKDNKKNYNICNDDLLEYLVHEIFYSIKSKYFEKLLLNKNYLDSNEFINYKNTIIKFIKLFIANYYDITYFDKIINKAKQRDKPTLLIIKKIYEIYLLEKKSSKEMDFDDMIYIATRLVKNNGINKNYKYIIIDEFQDTSKIRENLVKEIMKKTNAFITVVGDDFQSIYRFSGCDIKNFLNFSKNFKHVKKLYLTNTYRNSKELINVAGSFIMKNNRQIKKLLKSNKHLIKPIIILYYKDIKKDFTKAINYIDSNNLMILGRNNNDLYYCIDKKYIINNTLNIKDKNIYYKTIHKAKGLEEENVLIINLTNNVNSLPSKIKDEKILNYILLHKEYYPYEEERRLFYVALTRTKNYCYLFVDKNNPSIFIEELVKDFKKYISFVHL